MWRLPIGLEGVSSAPNPATYSDADFNVVFPDYFQTLGIPIVAGQDFSSLPDKTGSRVAIINETLAGRLWPGQDAIGQVS